MRRNLILFVVVLVLITLVAFFAVFRPQTNTINETRIAADDAEGRVKALQLRLEQLEALQKDAPRLRQEATVLDAAMPNDPQQALFISQVQDQADASGVEWLSVTAAVPAPSTTQPGIQEIAVTMSVSGGYFQVQDFLVRMETLARALKIGTLTMAPVAATSTAASPDLTSVLSLRLFVSSSSAAPPSTGAPTAPAGATTTATAS